MQHENQKSLTPKQQLAITKLIELGEVDKAASAVGVNRSTVHRWLKEEQFAREYRNAQRAVWNEAVGSLQTASKKAIETLVANLEKGSVGEQTNAARIILDMTIKSTNALEIEGRLADLEAALEIYKAGK